MKYLSLTLFMLVLASGLVKSDSSSQESDSNSQEGGSNSQEGGTSEACQVLIACENEAPLTISCPNTKLINVIEANYGRTVPDPVICPYYTSHLNLVDCYAAGSLSIVQTECDGKSSCSVLASNGVFGDPCRGTYKYLRVSYCCKKP